MPASALQALVKIAHTDLQQSLKQILEEILAQVVRHIGGHSGSTMLINEETGKLEMVATFGLPTDYIDRIYACNVPITCSPSGFVLKTGECYVVPNIFDEPRDRWWADLGKELGFSAQLFMPMNYEGKLIGLLNVYMHDPHDYSESEIAFVSIAASHAAAVIENARLYEKLVKKTTALEREIHEREDSEQALQYSEKMYRTLFESTGAALMVIEEDMTILHINEKMVSLWGYQKEELEGKVKWPELVAEADREQMMNYHRLRRTDHPEDAPTSYEFQFIHKNGELHDGSLVVGMIPGTRRSVVSIRDITAQKRTEQDLQRSEALYRTIFEATRAPTVILEEDGTFALTNMEGVKISGYSSKGDLEGKRKWTEFVASTEDLAKMREIHQLRRIAPDTAPRSYEFLFKDCYGNQKNICCTAAVIPGTKRSVVSFMDMTERRKTEAALRESEERFRSFFDELSLGIFMINPEGLIIAANKAFCQLIGYSQDELLGQHVSAFRHAEDAGKDTTGYAALVEGEQNRCVTERRLIRKNGETLWARLHLSSVKDADGIIKHATVLCENLTGYKNLAETLTAKRQDVENLMTQLNRAEAALRESEKKYKEITEFLPDLIYKSILIDS